MKVLKLQGGQGSTLTRLNAVHRYYYLEAARSGPERAGRWAVGIAEGFG